MHLLLTLCCLAHIHINFNESFIFSYLFFLFCIYQAHGLPDIRQWHWHLVHFSLSFSSTVQRNENWLIQIEQIFDSVRIWIQNFFMFMCNECLKSLIQFHPQSHQRWLILTQLLALQPQAWTGSTHSLIQQCLNLATWSSCSHLLAASAMRGSCHGWPVLWFQASNNFDGDHKLSPLLPLHNQTIAAVPCLNIWCDGLMQRSQGLLSANRNSMKLMIGSLPWILKCKGNANLILKYWNSVTSRMNIGEQMRGLTVVIEF